MIPESDRDTRTPARSDPGGPARTALRDLVRDEVVLSAGTWVVKVGTSVLTGPGGTLDPERIGHLAEQISAVMDSGRKVALVSSGAVGAGMGQLGMKSCSRRGPGSSRLARAFSPDRTAAWTPHGSTIWPSKSAR